MVKAKKIILSLVVFICLLGIMYSADFEIKPFIANTLNSFLAMADNGSIKTAKSIYEQGEQMRIIVEPNSEFIDSGSVGYRMHIKKSNGKYADFIVPEIPTKGGTYYYTLLSDAPLGTWRLALQKVFKEGDTTTSGDKIFYPAQFEVVKKGEGTEHEDVGPIPPECVPPDDVELIDCWYREHPECPRPTDTSGAPDTPDTDDPPSASSDECQLFYVKKEETNKCIETLKGSNVYESDPYGRKVESMMIIPGI